MYTTKRKQHKSRDAGTERKYHNFRPISDLPRLSNIFGCYAAASRPGLEPATPRSQVRRPTTKPPRHPA